MDPKLQTLLAAWHDWLEARPELSGEVLEKNVCPFAPEHGCFAPLTWRAMHKNLSLALMVTPNARSRGLEYLAKFSNGARELIFVEPYAFKPVNGLMGNDTLSDLRDVLALSNRQGSETICVHNNKNRPVAKYPIERQSYDHAKRELAQLGVKIKSSDLFHDRFLIKDRCQGIAIGGSLNGLGMQRLSFICELHKDDIDGVVNYMIEKGLIQ